MSRRDYVETARVVIELLAHAFPRAFFVYERRRVPLVVGVRAEIMRRLGDACPFTEAELGVGLSRYCHSDGYLWACSYHGRWRYDLDGAPVGEITREQAEQTRVRLALRRPRALPTPNRPATPTRHTPPPRSPRPAPRRSARHTPTPSTPSPTPTRRDGLADLRAGAMRRVLAGVD
jgi:sRNA-binding protein